jgi:ubiquinone/menaquinone biosynthesis C-methylase UbiE
MWKFYLLFTLSMKFFQNIYTVQLPKLVAMMNDAEIKNAVRKSWDCSSQTYDTCPGHKIGTREEKDAWKQELNRNLPPAPLDVLDVGCGTGAMGLLFAEMGHRVTGIDLSDEMMAKARRKAENQKLTITLQNGDAEHLPFSDGSFDLVVNRHLLWTLPHPETALKEWHRVLKNGGTALIIDGVWDDKKITTKASRALGDSLVRIFEPGDSHHKSYDPDLRNHLPHDGGVPHEVALSYMTRAGFTGMYFRDLKYIRELQKAELPWYRRLAQGKSYYILAAKKQG